jgi:dTDP-4-amino-4,6-dideoxygalactose transaminase
LRALGIGPGDEVVTVSHTFIATVSAIRLAGATPVLVDIDAATYTMDPDALAKAITPRTKAILPVHLYGLPADMQRIEEIAARHGVPVIEDAAQAHGARFHGRMVGTMSRAACFSFYPTKNLGAMGDAGAIATDDDALAGILRMARHHGQQVRNQHRILGRNSRLDEVQAAFLRVALRKLDANNRRRRSHASLYRELLGPHAVTSRDVPEREHVYHLFVVESNDRDGLQRKLESAGIGTGIHYPIPVHLQSNWDGPRLSLPATENAARRILSIPMFPELTEAEVRRVSTLIASSSLARHRGS